jgi:hypothetical protein
MKYDLKCDLNISCVKCFEIYQLKLFSPCFFCSIFHKKKMLPMFIKNIHFVFIINIIHPSTRRKIFLHVTKHYVPCVKKYSPNIPLTWVEYIKKSLVMVTCSCSHSQAHEITSFIKSIDHVLSKCHPPK